MISTDSMISPNSPDYDGILTRPPSTNLDSITPPCSDNGSSSQEPKTSKLVVDQPTPSKAHAVNSGYSPWLASLVYPIARYVILPLYFRRIEVLGRENFPSSGPVILAPTHRSRWDAFMVPYAVGQDITRRILRFMVTVDEVKGIQGWVIRRLGGFPIDTKHPAISALRYSVELLENNEALVIFPEGDIYRECQPLKPGLARLALQAEGSKKNLGIQIVPLGIEYSHKMVPWRCSVKIRIGPPLKVADYAAETPKLGAKRLTADLETTLKSLSSKICKKDC